jgi:multiple sugar transport system ATP-binding protein
MAFLEIRNLSKTYPGPIRALDDVSLSIEQGEFFSILGPTNAGKSTLLKSIAGIELPEKSRIHLADRDITWLEPRDRRLSLLFQNIALFPTRSGFDNIAFPMQVAKVPRAEIADRVGAVARLLKVDHLLDRLPRTFSGGEQQRVAIGRAIVQEADLLMLDEPLTNLDARIRIALRLELQKLHRQTGRTIIYVTHDQIEAMSMSDRIGILNAGRFEQIGTPDDIYHRPASAFVARFIGTPPMNILDCSLVEAAGHLTAMGDGFEAAVELRSGRLIPALPEHVAIGVRAEAIAASTARSDQAPHRGEIVWVERFGAYQVLDLRLGKQLIKIRTPSGHPVNREGEVWCGFSVKADHILDRQTGLFLRDPRDKGSDPIARMEEERCV